jgi:peptidyl-prolyl cis-trans isomerase SurA
MKKIALIILIITGLNAQEVLERIVAVVDNEVILKSELDYQVTVAAARGGLKADDPEFRKKILNQLIEEKLLYAQAELDSITVSNEEVEAQLENQLGFFIQQFGSRERLEQVYGMSIDKIRRELRDGVRKNLMAQMVQNKKFGNVDATRREVEEFFNTYQDSLGLVPEKFKISHIFINPKATEKLKNEARNLAQSLLDSLKAGADFSKLAKQYSDDPGSAAQGGNLGYVKRGVFFPEFEAAAFALKKGELSGVVESPVGFHVIQLLDRRGESINTRHILIKVKPDDEADLKAIEFLTEIRDSILKGEKSFSYFAKKYSDDKETAPFGGELGLFEKGQLDKPLLDQVYKLNEGEVGFPKRLELDPVTYGYHIVKLEKRIPEHKANLEMDYEEIKRLTIMQKRSKLYEKWIDEIKNDIYWEIRI